MKELWPQLVMVHGKPRHPQSQGSVERANSDIKDILVAWMTDNNTNDWTVGLKFTQQQNHAGINQTPYKALFGENPKVGLTSSSLPSEILERLQTEDDLLAICGQQSTADEPKSTPARTDEPQSTPARTDEPPSTPARTNEPQPTSARTNVSPSTLARTDEPQPTSARTDEPPSTPARTDEPQSTPARTDEPPSTPARTDEPQPTSARTNVPQPSSARTDVPQPTPARTDEPQPTSARTNEPQPIPTRTDEPQPTSARINKPQPTPASDSNLAQRHETILQQRKRARDSQLSQAERMVKSSRVELKSGEVGDNVAIPIPMVDRGRGNQRNILGVILDCDEQNMYTIAVKSGIISSKYARNQFDLCPQRLLTNCDVNTECTVTLRQAVKATTTGGQGFFRCDCGNGKKNNVKPTDVSVLRLAKCVTADVITVSRVRISRQCM